MNNGGIDASLGLDVALATLRRFRKHGVLQAEVLHIPGIQGRCHCSIFLSDGNITSCVATNATGREFTLKIDVIVATDRKKGPFSWSFHPQTPTQRPSQQSSSPQQPLQPHQLSPSQQPPQSIQPYQSSPDHRSMQQQSSPQHSLQPYAQLSPAQWQRQLYQNIAYPISPHTVPIPRMKLDLDWLNTLPPNEKVFIGWIFSLLDGQRTVNEIASLLPRLKTEDVIRGLQILQARNVITFAER